MQNKIKFNKRKETIRIRMFPEKWKSSMHFYENWTLWGYYIKNKVISATRKNILILLGLVLVSLLFSALTSMDQFRSKSCHLYLFIHSSTLFWANSSSVIKTSVWAGLGEGESLWAQVKHRQDFLLSFCQAAGLCRVMGVLGRGEKDLAMAAPNSSHHRILKESRKEGRNKKLTAK